MIKLLSTGKNAVLVVVAGFIGLIAAKTGSFEIVKGRRESTEIDQEGFFATPDERHQDVKEVSDRGMGKYIGDCSAMQNEADRYGSRSLCPCYALLSLSC